MPIDAGTSIQYLHGVGQARAALLQKLGITEVGHLLWHFPRGYEFRGNVKQLADGRLYTAKQALELNLVDGIGLLEDAVKDMRKEFGLWDCEFIDFCYEYDSGIGVFDLLYYLTGNTAPQEARALAKSKSDVEFPLNYLCTVMGQE